jgi:hypothetical protein
MHAVALHQVLVGIFCKQTHKIQDIDQTEKKSPKETEKMRVCMCVNAAFLNKNHIPSKDPYNSSNCKQLSTNPSKSKKTTIREPIYAAICGTIKCNKCIEIYCGSNYLGTCSGREELYQEGQDIIISQRIEITEISIFVHIHGIELFYVSEF